MRSIPTESKRPEHSLSTVEIHTKKKVEGSAKRVAGVGEEVIECVVVGELREGGGAGVVGGVGEVGDKLGA